MGKIRKPGTAAKSLNSKALEKKKQKRAPKSLDSISLNKKKQKQFSKKTKLSNKLRKGNTAQKTVSNGVIRLTNIPHGFYEEQMQRYFSQFGKVLDIKVARSRKNGEPLGLAYVKFLFRGVARIVADSMNGYLMFNKIMRCKYIKSGKVNEIMMFGNKYQNVQFCPGVLKRRFTVHENNRRRTDDEEGKRLSRVAEKVMKKEKMLKNMGITINLNVPEDKIFKREKKLPDSNKIKVEYLTTEESKTFNEAKDELANTIKTKLEERKENSPKDEGSESETEKEEDEDDAEAKIILEQKENSPEDEDSESKTETEKVEDEDEAEAKIILEVDESEDEIVIKTPPNAIKRVKKSTASLLKSKGDKVITKRKSTLEEPKSFIKKGKLEIDPSAQTPKIKTLKSKLTNSDTPKVSKQEKKLKTPKKLIKDSIKKKENTPVLSKKKSKLPERMAATPGLKTPKNKKIIKIPKSA